MKVVFSPPREHDFQKITVFKKIPKTYPPGTCFATQNRRKSTPNGQKIIKIAKNNSFWSSRKSCVFLHAKKTQKNTQKVKKCAARRNARGLRGGKEGCITLQKSACGRKSCKEFCKGVYAELWQASSTPRRGAADLSAARIPPGLVFLNFEPCQCQI